METQGTLSKLEYQYLQNISKLEEITSKLEGKLSTVEKLNIELTEKNKTLQAENEELKTECKDTVEQAQGHIDNVEEQHDELEKQIEELKKQVLPEAEMLFYFGCKADAIFDVAFNSGILALTSDYLKEKNFPDVLLSDKDFDGITTSNFKLIKTDDKKFALTKN
jgi:DNA repair exonuclease SbcCD ATPase subunit